MKMIKIKTFLLLATIFFILLSANFTGKTTKDVPFENTSLKINNYPAEVVNHTQIYIDGNNELATFIGNEGLSGDGTYASPYIIENFTINASIVNGIEIRNTDAYLIIQNCVIEGEENFYDGIYLKNTTNVKIINNNLTFNHFGIYLGESSNNTISMNNVSYYHAFGIILKDSSNNTLSGNNVYNNVMGIILRSSSNNTISGNNVSYNHGDGIILWSSSNNNTCTSNNASNNEMSGFYLEELCIENIIYNNDIYGNNFIQAYEDDYYTNNQWDNGSIGNYWGNDYIIKCPNATNDGTVWDTPYEINGEGDGMDNFPLVKSLYLDFETPQFTDIPQDFRANEGYTGLSIAWNAADLHPATYKIELDGTEMVSATAWTSGTVISYDIPDGLLEGDYNFTIIISDENGNIAQDSMIFTVGDIESPQFIDLPQDFSAVEGYSGLNISWVATDLNPDTYTINLDGIEVVSATTWVSGDVISYFIPNGLLEGDYIITIIVSDEYGNIAQDTVIFTVNIISDSEISGFPIHNAIVLIFVCTFILIRKLNNRRNG